MTVRKDNQRYQITITPGEKAQLRALFQATKERSSALIRRLICTEKRLYDSGFLPAYNSKVKKKGANDMLWLILKCIFWVLLGFILLCELAAIRVSGLCSREEERQEALEKHCQQAKSAP